VFVHPAGYLYLGLLVYEYNIAGIIYSIILNRCTKVQGGKTIMAKKNFSTGNKKHSSPD
jgi:hypothetical protein